MGAPSPMIREVDQQNYPKIWVIIIRGKQWIKLLHNSVSLVNSYVRLIMLKIEKAKAKQRQIRKPESVVENIPPQTKGKSRDKVAEQLGVSGRQLDKIKYVEDKAPEKLKDQWENKEVSTGKAYDTIKQLEKVNTNSAKVSFNRTNDNIEWAIWTWNPVTGCKGDCSYCYARDIASSPVELIPVIILETIL